MSNSAFIRRMSIIALTSAEEMVDAMFQEGHEREAIRALRSIARWADTKAQNLEQSLGLKRRDTAVDGKKSEIMTEIELLLQEV